MTKSRGHPTPGEWEQQKPEFERLYLTLNWTLKAVREHFAERGFDATLRQYKTKVSAWGFDLKKIKRPVWKAMLVVMKDRLAHGLTSTFLVPVRSSEVTVVRPDKVQKEVQRNGSAPERCTLEEAKQILHSSRVRICSEDDPEVLAQLHLLQLDSEQDASQPDQDLLGQESISPELIPHQPQRDYTSSSSTQNVYAMRMAQTPPKRAYQMPYDRPSGSRSAMPIAPPPASQTMWSNQERLSYSQPARFASTARYFDSSRDHDTWSAVYELLRDPSCSDQLPDTSGSATQLQNLEQMQSRMDDNMLLAARWAAPYFRSLSARLDKRVPFVDIGREDAKVALREMLESSNRYIFLLCHWMTTVLASLDQKDLMIDFLTDCQSVINPHPNGHSITYGSPINLLLALTKPDKSDFDEHRERLVKSAIIFKVAWKPQSSNYLINQHYHAWLLLEQKQHEEAEKMLEFCLEVSKQIMGEQHLVTINSLAMLSRSFSETGRISDAIVKLHDLLARLASCHRYLYAFRDRQQYRLAELQMKQGELEDAEKLLLSVLAFRIDMFGLAAPITWSAIETLQECFRLQGRHEEAAGMYDHYCRLYNQESLGR